MATTSAAKVLSVRKRESSVPFVRIGSTQRLKTKTQRKQIHGPFAADPHLWPLQLDCICNVGQAKFKGDLSLLELIYGSLLILARDKKGADPSLHFSTRSSSARTSLHTHRRILQNVLHATVIDLLTYISAKIPDSENAKLHLYAPVERTNKPRENLSRITAQLNFIGVFRQRRPRNDRQLAKLNF
jgi:hypothetical protein